ncbi:thiol protease/hemagglutinin PrtT [Candidatus Sulfidibacterium hydrothermale]|uniref:C10 family peptidase n=1 Tax=Candidatus Sulfidibacterium hydrothermale TaxID=2875962 RepID=UPI001F0A8EA9|nr:C10 family peptidase [Candidatus Sulfidibacterium hydrothermale]UBM62629.1 thiol protease/hemagglutinin PrtT [Candidatus Sulfidibacterium hydrothermale]
MKKLFASIFLIAWAAMATGQNVPIRTARAFAKNQYTQFYQSRFKTSPVQVTISDEYSITSGNDTLYYVFNFGQNRGFVILSADRRVYPVIGYAFKGSYSPYYQPPAFSDWMKEKKQEIIQIKTSNIQPNQTIKNAWSNLKTSNENEKIIGPLLETTWDQGCYYNASCPEDIDGHCGHALTGCVATAMAQVMKYWSFPKHGKGSHTDNTETYGKLTVNFGATTYQWSDMPDRLDSANNAVATLMYHCGVSIDMDYGPKSSGSHTSYTVSALTDYFYYAPTAHFVEKESYSDAQWESLIKTELDSLRPILYRGHKASGGGHSFVCDGYQGDFFHFNWGWNGTDDGYFFLNNLSPTSTRNYSYQQGAVIGTHPLKPDKAGSITGDTVVCQGQDSVLYTLPEIATATSYVWTLPDGKTVETSTDSVYIHYGSSSVSGFISVYGKNKYSKGAPDSLAIRIKKQPATPVITLQNGNILHSNTPTGNQWFNQNGMITDSTRQNFTVKEKGNYYVVVTQNGCRSDTSNHIVVVETGIHAFSSSPGIKIYPNPVKEQVTLEFPRNEYSQGVITIQSVNGKIYLKQQLPKGQLKITLHLKQLPQGIYILKVKSLSETFTKELLKL